MSIFVLINSKPIPMDKQDHSKEIKEICYTNYDKDSMYSGSKKYCKSSKMPDGTFEIEFKIYAIKDQWNQISESVMHYFKNDWISSKVIFSDEPKENYLGLFIATSKNSVSIDMWGILKTPAYWYNVESVIRNNFIGTPDILVDVKHPCVKDTISHEIGHFIMRSNGGYSYSVTHKGSSSYLQNPNGKFKCEKDRRYNDIFMYTKYACCDGIVVKEDLLSLIVGCDGELGYSNFCGGKDDKSIKTFGLKTMILGSRELHVFKNEKDCEKFKCKSCSKVIKSGLEELFCFDNSQFSKFKIDLNHKKKNGSIKKWRKSVLNSNKILDENLDFILKKNKK